MSRLPSGGNGYDYLIQQIEGEVVLFQEVTEDEVVRFNPSDPDATAKAQHVIHQDTNMTDEQKSFAHFWSGYFYAHAGSH